MFFLFIAMSPPCAIWTHTEHGFIDKSNIDAYILYINALYIYIRNSVAIQTKCKCVHIPLRCRNSVSMAQTDTLKEIIKHLLLFIYHECNTRPRHSDIQRHLRLRWFVLPQMLLLLFFLVVAAAAASFFLLIFHSRKWCYCCCGVCFLSLFRFGLYSICAASRVCFSAFCDGVDKKNFTNAFNFSLQ